MTATNSPVKGHRFGGGLLIVLCAILAPTLLVYGITGYFRLGSETAALRDSVREALPGACSTTVAVNVGPLTTGLIRMGVGMIDDVPPEARQAMKALHAAEAGVYHVNRWLGPRERAKIATDANRAMQRRGWVRIVAVTKDQDLVQVFMPEKATEKNLRFSVLVLHEQELVVASVKGNLEPIMTLVSQQMNLSRELDDLAQR